MPPFLLIQPPAAYAETAQGIRVMATQFREWCVPAAEVPEIFRPGGRDPICRTVPQAQLTLYAYCVRQLLPQPEVVARPGEVVRFHVAAEVGPPRLTVARGSRIDTGGGPDSWTATAGGPADIGLTATSTRGTVTYGARVVVAKDVRRPEVRINLRRRTRTLELAFTRSTRVSVCLDGIAGRRDPLRLGLLPPGRARVDLGATMPTRVMLVVRSAAGVERHFELRPSRRSS